MDFIHLHAHTHYSMQSSPIFPDEIFSAAVKFGMKSVAVTDYCAMFNMPELFSEAKSAGIKLIIGSELLLLETDAHQHSRIPVSPSLVLLVQNDAGYRNLCILLSRAAREGFVNGMPHIESRLLESCHEGLIALSAYSAGRIGRALLAGATDEAETFAAYYKQIFGDRFYLELQRHNTPFDDKLNEQTIALAEKLGIELVATNNVHYLERKDADCYRAMVANRTKEKLSNQNLQALAGSDHYLKSSGEMSALFSDAHRELSNTALIAGKCSYSFSDKEPILPHFPLPEGFESEFAYLRHLTLEGAKEKYADADADGISAEDVRARIELELGVIEKMGFSSYFLIVSDLIAASRRLGYSVGPGRGSAAGSIVAYLTGITRIDPLKYKLLFERFLNPERSSMPDIDIDFTPVGKQKVLEYTVEKYGTESVAKVIAIGTFAAKAAIRDAGRVLEVPLPLVDKLAKLVPVKPGITLEKALSEAKEMQQFAESTPELRELIRYARALEGRARNVSMHAGAVVITDGRLEEQVPLYVSNKIETEVRKFADEIDLDEPDHVRGKASDGSEEKQVVTQFDKNWIETSGLLKIDYLGLETLAVIDETLKMIKRRHNLDIELEKVPMNDRKTFRIFQEGKMAGIFQFESSGMQSYMTRLQPTQIGDIIAMSALYRPGALNARIDEKRNAVDLFVDRKHGREAIDYMHPMLETILKETYGVIVYQEQVMQISQVMGGFSLAKADNLRKAMGKKKPEIMEKYKADFVQGAIKQGVHDTLATRVFELMAEFAGYGFNKSHSAAYGVLAYWTGYLKAHYTIEFVTAVLNSEIGDIERMKHLTDEAKSFGISTLPPSINKSDALFAVEDAGGRSFIRVGLSAIKQVGAAARAVVTSRLRRKRDFVNLFDLAASVDLRVMNRKALECLILSGAFDEIDQHRARLLANVDKAFKFGQMQNRSVTLGQCGFFTAEEGAELEEAHYPDMDAAEMMPEAEKLLHEKKLVGFYLSHHPLSPYRRDWQAFATLQLDAKEVVAAKQYKVLGLIVSVKPYQDRKGKQMLFGIIEDFTGKADFTVFASLYEQYGHLIKPEEVLMLVAEGEVSGGMLKLLVREIIPIKKVRNALVKKVVLKVDADDQLQMEKLGRVKKIFDANKGGTPVEFEVKAQSGENIETISIFARSTPIDAGESTIEKLEEVLGPDNVRISG
ncbi:DNA polymerase III subunit alpha [Pelodictyon phaeoclathratiforme]|jgi:DNA polymerase-3 subunit alpha|uniref:DNA polymerase III subunit alpha n=1 Tax=Pelodictyon phaeoclathratiforme (strain DSM 5477 / BU-1) TaxID=324925 RepID=B4SAB0_PELPB|nr:DNA polymerase III subunit alpha [Pelodictyon phaeoclathratiforme]ACF43796.1 DNA polymerase III, alpha subunit [Pelodictyon phaeoclathratiforme BU-1]MBV5289613.1 DNA polymerase III subunit alpha [Pelodictyon phaeoclathratiforme]